MASVPPREIKREGQSKQKECCKVIVLLYLGYAPGAYYRLYANEDIEHRLKAHEHAHGIHYLGVLFGAVELRGAFKLRTHEQIYRRHAHAQRHGVVKCGRRKILAQRYGPHAAKQDGRAHGNDAGEGPAHHKWHSVMHEVEDERRDRRYTEPPHAREDRKRVIAIARKDAKYQKRAKYRRDIVAHHQNKADKQNEHRHACDLCGCDARSVIYLGGRDALHERARHEHKRSEQYQYCKKAARKQKTSQPRQYVIK